NRLSNVRCLCTAVGGTEGVQEFYFPDEDEPVSSSLRSDMLLASLPAGTVRHMPVSVLTLDQLVAEEQLTRVSLVKLDTERTEHEVLAGALKTLARDRPEIICEVWPDADNQRQLEDILRPLDYHFFQLLPAGPAARTEIVGSALALNYLSTVRPGEIGL
ncbi:MAG: FkbM family methyltransferase, partial [bacterium]